MVHMSLKTKGKSCEIKQIGGWLWEYAISVTSFREKSGLLIGKGEGPLVELLKRDLGKAGAVEGNPTGAEEWDGRW